LLGNWGVPWQAPVCLNEQISAIVRPKLCFCN
jgi:hypothetical protein